MTNKLFPLFSFFFFLTPFICPGCSNSDAGRDAIIVDLNSTTQAASLECLLGSTTGTLTTVTPNAAGAYLLNADSLPSGLYDLRWDSAHVLPLVVEQHRGLKVCGTFAQWRQLTFSDSATSVAFQATLLSCDLARNCDSALTCANLGLPTGRRLVADSLLAIHSAARQQAVKLMERAKGTLGALVVASIPGAFGAIRDNELLQLMADELSFKYPQLTQLTELSASMRRAGKLARLKEELGAGAKAPQMLFLTTNGDSLTQTTLLKKRWALALLPDSAAAGSILTEAQALYARGVKILLEGDHRISMLPANSKKPAATTTATRASVVRGHVARIDAETDLRSWAPALIVVSEGGYVERLVVGTEAYALSTQAADNKQQAANDKDKSSGKTPTAKTKPAAKTSNASTANTTTQTPTGKTDNQ